MSEELPVFLKRPSFHQDDSAISGAPFIFMPELSGKEIMADTDKINNVLDYLDGLDLDSTEVETSINSLRDLLADEERLKAEIAEKAETASGEGSGEDAEDDSSDDLFAEEGDVTL